MDNGTRYSSYFLLYADGVYNCLDWEDVLQDESIHGLAKRGSQSKK